MHRVPLQRMMRLVGVLQVLVHCDAEGVPTASEIAFTTVAAGKSVTFFARFPGPPQTSKSVTFYIPDTPPLTGLTIE